MNEKLKQKILDQQKAEITEHNIYKNLAKKVKDSQNKEILEQISQDELRHHDFLKKITNEEVKPNKIKIKYYSCIAKVFGLTFALRLMEKGEGDAQDIYESLSDKYPNAINIKKDEEEHENKLIGILKDERLNYAGSVVLGLNDALVELTGTLAGLTFAFANSSIIAVTGLIMGVAASLSMAASGYLSSKESENDGENPITSAIYTGVAYVITVILLITPYLLINNPYIALGTMMTIAILIIAAYTFYISIAKNLKFNKRFIEMALISLGVAIISFGIGLLVKQVFGIEV